jgi:hypothetical protein
MFLSALGPGKRDHRNQRNRSANHDDQILAAG